MRLWKTHLTALTAALLVGLLAACGTAEPAATPTQAAAAEALVPTPITAAAPVAEPVTGTVATEPAAQPSVVREKPEYGGIVTHRSSGGEAAVDPYNPLNRSGNSTYGVTWWNGLVHLKFPFDPAKGRQTDLQLASEYSQSEDGSKWIFKLRPGVTWHDGEAFNADDVVATIERLVDPGVLISPRPSPMKNVFKGAKKIDDYSVVIDTGTPDSTAFSWLLTTHASIQPEHLIKGESSSSDPKKRWRFVGPDPVKETGTLAVGTGPFIMKKFDKEVAVSGVRNPNYFRKDEDGNPLPYLDGIEYLTLPDGTRALANFVAGRVTYSYGLGAGMHPKEARALCKNTRDKDCYTIPFPHGAFSQVMNHVSTPIFTDPQVAAAVRYSMDMEEITRLAYGGRLGFTWMDRQIWPDAALNVKEQYEVIPWSDPARRAEFVQKAKDVLGKAGYPSGVDLPLPFFGSCNGSFLDHSSRMADQMFRVGIRNFLECRAGIVADQEIKGGRFSIAMSVQNQFRADPGHMVSLGALLDSPAAGRAPWRWGTNQEQLDRLYRDTVKTVDDAKRNEKWREMERFLADPGFTTFPGLYSSVEMSVHGCVKNFRPGTTWESGNYSHEHTWLTKECR